MITLGTYKIKRFNSQGKVVGSLVSSKALFVLRKVAPVKRVTLSAESTFVSVYMRKKCDLYPSQELKKVLMHTLIVSL